MYFVSFRQQGGGRYHQFPDIQRHNSQARDEKTITLLSASQHPLPSSSHPWHKQQLGPLSISSAGGKVPGTSAKGLSLSCQHSLSPSIAVLTRHAKELLASALAPGTQAAYKRSWCMFGKFCNTHGLPDTVPISVSVLALFIPHLHRAGYSPATVSSHISAIGYIHKLQGGSDPATTFLVQKLLSACHKLSKQFSLRMPIDQPMLSKLLGALEFTVPGKHHRALYKAMFCLAFHALLRIGEMTVQLANATNPNLLPWKQLEIRHILDSDLAVETARNQRHILDSDLHSLQAQQRQAPDPDNERHHLTAGLPSSNPEGILDHARCYSRSFISVLPQCACHACQV